MTEPVRATPADVPALLAFLTGADLTLSGLDDPDVRLWLLRDGTGRVRGSTGYELSADGRHALVRSTAVEEGLRGRGTGLELASWALTRAAAEGARRAWLFSRRSGPFWQRLGFAPADRGELAEVLAGTHQVDLFRRSGQLEREVAWSRPLGPGAAPAGGHLPLSGPRGRPHAGGACGGGSGRGGAVGTSRSSTA